MIQIEFIEQGFRLFFKQHPVLSHSEREPCLSLGKGSADYHMAFGNFDIREDLHQKMPLPYFRILENLSQYAAIELCEKSVAASEQSIKIVVEFRERDGHLEICFVSDDPSINRFWLSLCAVEKEHLYGCGEQFSVSDLKGKQLLLWVSEGGVGRGKDAGPILAMHDIQAEDVGNCYTTYYPQPSFVSSENYYYHLECSAYAECDFSAADRHQLYVREIPQKLIFDKQESAPKTVESLSAFLGRQPGLADWLHDGVWLGVQGGTEIVERKLRRALDAGVKVAGIWAQDWEGKRETAFGKQLFWDWKYDAALYPELPEYIERLQQQGIRFFGYINPCLALEGTLYQEASQRGYLVKKETGEEYHIVVTSFPAALLDLSNPDARIWIKQIVRENMIGIGLAGWMADYGEYLPVDAILDSGEPAELYHNRYPVEWAQINAEAIQEAGKSGEVVFFTRAGYSGTSRHSTLVWTGDQLVGWSLDDGLASAISASVSSGFCGVGFSHSDIGGFTTLGPYKRSKELFMRWTEMAVFSAMMRTHEGNRPDDNWQFDSDEETLQHFAGMSALRVRLKPYISQAVEEYRESGLPLMRHPFLHYEHDEQLHELHYQYLFGRDLLVAPVYLPGVTSWKVYLPEDQWGFLWDRKQYAQGWHTVEAPLGKPPVFYRLASSWLEMFRSL
ncbi:MAG: alpha-glucosidase [bacterium]|nr:alpha-glucosidase [bacterium]